MTAVYAGDSNYLSVTSSALSQVVSDLNLEIASGGSNRASVAAGGTATYHLTIAPSSGSVLPAAVTLSASGGPAGSTITITPHNIAAGAATTTVTVAVQVPAAAAGVRKIQAWAFGFAFPLIGMLLLPFGTEGKRRSRTTMLFMILLAVVLLSGGAILGCGGNTTAPPERQAIDYNITVTAVSGQVSHATTLTLTVQ
jgi:hypothetical protein